MTLEKLSRLTDECAADLSEARRQGHKGWITTLVKRQIALKDIAARMPVAVTKPDPKSSWPADWPTD